MLPDPRPPTASRRGGLPFSAGVTLYVAASDLIPEVNREPKFGMAVMVFAGVAVMLGLKAVFHL